jgi:chitin disaccharide deacetylase
VIRHLIVTADDFGLTAGVTRGIARAHAEGIVTATSLMVDEPAAAEAADRARDLPALDVGLHAVAPDDGDWAAALERQLARFDELMGRPPTHLDSHHDVHHAAEALPHFLSAARALNVPVRGHGPARHFSRYYGRWGGVSHPEHLARESLLRLVDEHVGGGWTELNCHPGQVDADLRSSYTTEREVELAVLRDARVRRGLAERGIQLAGFRDLVRVAA